uniref:Uncharacterized protein n=1 Tax=Brassica oleracea var. oleracea TaxID=109376 RepID=A0A0D3BWF4_BRAOL
MSHNHLRKTSQPPQFHSFLSSDSIKERRMQQRQPYIVEHNEKAFLKQPKLEEILEGNRYVKGTGVQTNEEVAIKLVRKCEDCATPGYIVLFRKSLTSLCFTLLISLSHARHIPNHLLQKATVEAPKQWWKLRQTRLWSSTALASPPHHHHRFIKEQGKEKQWYDIAAFPDQAWCGGEVVVVRWRCEHHGRRRVKKNVVWWLY